MPEPNLSSEASSKAELSNRMRTIQEKREALELIIKNAYDTLGVLQNQCEHKGDLTYKYEGGGDGWSSADTFWMEWHCHECGKRWTTSQDNAFELTTKVHPNAKQVRK
jgi:hypothetical protein